MAELNIPKEWVQCKISDFAHIVMGQSPSSSSYNDKEIGLPFYQGKAEFGDIYPETIKWCNAPKKIAEQGSVLLSVRAPVGPTNIAPYRSCIGRGLAAIHPLGDMQSKFILYLFRNFEPMLSGQGKGTTFKAITKDDLFSLNFALPSLSEQVQILKKVEGIFSDLDNAVANLKKAKEQLKIYRQSVLKYAFEGKLTSNTGHFRQIEIGSVCERIQNVKNEISPEEKFLYIDIGCIDGKFNRITNNKVYLWSNAPSRAKQIIKSGDILFSTVRTYLKKIALVPAKYNNQICSTGFCVIRPQKSILDSNYIFRYVLWEKFINTISTFQTGTSYPAVRDEDVFSQLIPLPDLSIQKRIVQEIESRLSVCDKMEETIESSLNQAEVLRRCILKQAFEGKLTEQWRKENKDLISGESSAEVLLKKIKAEKETLKVICKGKRKHD